MGLADKMNEKKKSDKSFDGYAYVIVSTLNQMVNYIPLKHFGFKEIYNITTTDVGKNNDNNKTINSRWDDNLKKVIQNNHSIRNIDIDEKSFYSLTSVKNRLETEVTTGVLKDKKIFWNITGGQRHILMAINHVAKDGDVLCYLEGNNNQMMIYDVSTKLTEPNDYSLNLDSDLNIDIALKLMGLQFQSSNQEMDTDFYKQFYSEYEKNKILREWLIILNKNYPKMRDKKKNESDEGYKKYQDSHQNNKKQYDAIKNNAKDEIKKILSELDQALLDIKLNRSQAFGYILEELTFYKLKESLGELIKDKKVMLVHSLKIKDESNNNQTVAEFDIALLTNNGKFIMFECKSGVMEGDTAKARKYVTYAVGGVYGLPILINPLLSTESTKSDVVKDLDIDIYKYINEAKSSAKRAFLEVWGIDEIKKDKIKEELTKHIDNKGS